MRLLIGRQGAKQNNEKRGWHPARIAELLTPNSRLPISSFPKPHIGLAFLLSAVIAVSLVCGGCEKPVINTPPEPQPEPAPVVPPQAVPSPDPDLAKTMREDLDAAYRLRPDKRVLLAIAEIHYFLTHQRPQGGSCEFNVGGGGPDDQAGADPAGLSDGYWKIAYSGMDVGSLSERPDFAEFMLFLDNWVQTLQNQYPLELATETNVPRLSDVQNRLDEFWGPEVMQALRDLDNLWNQGYYYPTSLYSATRGMVILSVQQLDRMETADRLYAKALALLAMTKALTSYPCVREESLLAYTMGYSEHAQTVALDLHESDAVRVYVDHDDVRLGTIVRQEDVSPEARYLYSLRLAMTGGEMGGVVPFVDWVTEAFPDRWLSLPILKAGLDLKSFSTNPALCEGLPGLVVANMIQDNNPEDGLQSLLAQGGKRYDENALRTTMADLQQTLKADATRAGLADRFEAELEGLRAKCTGLFLDSEVCGAYYRGHFYSAMYVAGLYYLDTLEPAEAERACGEFLGETTNRITVGFRHWYRGLAASKAGKVSLAAMIDDLARQGDLGAPAVLRVFERQKPYFTYGDPEMLDAIKRIVPRLDTRIAHRAALGDRAYTDLFDLKLAETLYQSVVKADPARYHNLRVWLANFTGNTILLRELLLLPATKPQAKARILGYLEKLPDADHGLMEYSYQQLIQENSDSLTMPYNYANYLERQGQYPEARRVLEEWLALRVPGQAGGESKNVFARSKIAWLYYLEGRYEEGWNTIEPVLRTSQAGAMERAAELLDKRGLTKAAEKMGEAVVSEYPDSVRTRALLAGLYWQHGKYADAALLLNAAPRTIGTSDWRFVIAPKFADVFLGEASADPSIADRREEALTAFSALLAEGIGPFELEGLLYPVEKNGAYQLAFEMLSKLRVPGASGEYEFTVRAFKNLSQWKGKEEALVWLREMIPSYGFGSASIVIYEQEEYDLLWDLIQEVPQGESSDFIWLMRAAAAIHTGGDKAQHYAELLDYFNNATAGETPMDDENRSYTTIGRFLLDLASENEVLALADSPQRTCEVAYYIGLRAQLKGKYGVASDWYRMAIETGQSDTGEYRWAYDMLYTWQVKGKSLDLLEAEKT